MTATPVPEDIRPSSGLHWMARGWLLIGPIVFVAAAATAYRPSFAGPWETVLAMLPILVFVATMTALLAPFRDIDTVVHRVAIAVAFIGWAILMFDDANWSILTFILFAVSFASGPIIGVAIAGATSLVWTIAWLVADEPLWILPIPAAVFFVGSLIAVTIYRIERTNDEQAELIHELTTTRQALAASERSKGILEERARFASEIHDTLTQGFASIVLVSRAALRAGDTERALTSIESTALENLDAARRLVDAIRPAELDTASLPDALARQLETALPNGIRSQFQLVGRPRALSGTVEVVLLRATQEALLNVKNHARAQHVHVTLSYLDDMVALDVRDDGIGFVPGELNDRGRLTGGQGLKALEERARSLSGEMTVEAIDSGGSVLSILLPAAGS